MAADEAVLVIRGEGVFGGGGGRGGGGGARGGGGAMTRTGGGGDEGEGQSTTQLAGFVYSRVGRFLPGIVPQLFAEFKAAYDFMGKGVQQVGQAAAAAGGGAAGMGMGRASGVFVFGFGELALAQLWSIGKPTGLVKAPESFAKFNPGMTGGAVAAEEGAVGAGTAATAAGGVMAFLSSPVGIAVAAVTALGVASAIAAKAVDSMAMRFIDKFAEYNPEVALAKAMNEIEGTMNDMRRAQQSGPQLAQYARERFKLEQDVEDIKLGVTTTLLPLVQAIVEGVHDALVFLHVVNANPAAIEDMAEAALRAMRDQVQFDTARRTAEAEFGA